LEAVTSGSGRSRPEQVVLNHSVSVQACLSTSSLNGKAVAVIVLSKTESCLVVNIYSFSPGSVNGGRWTFPLVSPRRQIATCRNLQHFNNGRHIFRNSTVLFHFISPNQPMDRHSQLLETSIHFYHAVQRKTIRSEGCWRSINTWLRDA
jgi:hypothetical protein